MLLSRICDVIYSMVTLWALNWTYVYKSWYKLSLCLCLFVFQGDGGGRESLSELQYKRLVDFVTEASQYLSPSVASLSHQTFISPAEPPPTATKIYHYQADPAFAQVFICKFTMVKNKALRIGFHWQSSSHEKCFINIKLELSFPLWTSVFIKTLK